MQDLNPDIEMGFEESKKEKQKTPSTTGILSLFSYFFKEIFIDQEVLKTNLYILF